MNFICAKAQITKEKAQINRFICAKAQITKDRAQIKFKEIPCDSEVKRVFAGGGTRRENPPLHFQQTR